jgi:large subunit ribosomal protein L15
MAVLLQEDIRVPKFGFKNPGTVTYKAVNLDDLQKLSESIKGNDITVDVLVQNGIVGKRDIIKVLGRGELKAKLNVSVHAISKTAQEAIEKTGGTVTKL